MEARPRSIGPAIGDYGCDNRREKRSFYLTSKVTAPARAAAPAARVEGDIRLLVALASPWCRTRAGHAESRRLRQALNGGRHRQTSYCSLLDPTVAQRARDDTEVARSLQIGTNPGRAGRFEP